MILASAFTYLCAMDKFKEQIATQLLEIEAVRLNVTQPFEWASGWLSPIYCDNRITLSYPKTRNFIKECFVEVIKKEYSEVEVIAGVATAGIPQASILADALGLPLIYVRSKSKGHGLQNQIEGYFQKGQKVLVVEDLVSTGKSSLDAAQVLQSQGMEVLGMLAIFTYAFKAAQDNFEKANLPLFTLSDYPALLREAIKKNYIPQSSLGLLEAWRNDPANWKID